MQVLSISDCQALAASSHPALHGLPVSEETWRRYYRGKLPPVREPWIVHCMGDDKQAEVLVFVEPDLAWFAGHFPGAPLLPGVVQLQWTISLGAELFGQPFAQEAFAGLSRVKFKAPVLPGTIIQFQLSAQPGRIALRIASPAGTHTEGRLLYRG